MSIVRWIHDVSRTRFWDDEVGPLLNVSGFPSDPQRIWRFAFKAKHYTR